MHILLRLFVGLLLLWAICNFFYSLGRKSAFKDSSRKRKKVDSSAIEDEANNFTRFLVIGENMAEKSGKDKTSVLFSTKDKAGALYGMLEPFAKNKINLTKIESRPSRRKVWEYVFFVDFEGHLKEERVKKSLRELEKRCVFLKVLGSYPVGN